MRHRIILAVIVFGSLLCGCETVRNAGRLSTKEISIVTLAARERANQELDLTESERKAIQEDEPIISCYILADTFAQYAISWKLPTGMSATISGTGDILTLDGANVLKTDTKTK